MQRRVEIKKQQALALRNKKKRERERARELAEEAADLAEAEAGAEPPSMDGEACCEALALRPVPATATLPITLPRVVQLAVPPSIHVMGHPTETSASL